MLVFVMAAQGIFAAFVNGWYYETPDKTLVSGPQWFLLIIFFFYIYNIQAFILCTSSLSWHASSTINLKKKKPMIDKAHKFNENVHK
jgi:hypothetical protein